MDKKYITTVLLELCVVFMYDNMLQEKQKSNPPLDVSSATAARVLG
jgi:hypothetical protein